MEYAIIVKDGNQMFVSCETLAMCRDFLEIRMLMYNNPQRDKDRAYNKLVPYLDAGNPEAEYLWAGFIFSNENTLKRWRHPKEVARYPRFRKSGEHDNIHFDYIKKSAEKKYPPALYSYGVFFDVGDGVKENKPKAAKLFKEAALLGHVHSLWIYGQDMLVGAQGINKDEKRGMEFIMRSAEAKSEGAYKTLIYYHEKELYGFKNDKNEIAKLKEKLKDPNIIGY